MTGYTHAMGVPGDSGPARFAAILAGRGMVARPQRLPGSTRTAAEAALAIGCSVAEIAKSIVFRLAESGDAVLAIACGTNRVDTGKLQLLAGENIAKADAGFVRRQTGYAIGGVPPFGHDRPIKTFVDQDLFRFDTIWAAAGGSFDVFATTPNELLAASNGTKADIRL